MRRRLRLLVVALLTVAATVVGIGVGGLVTQADSTALNVIVSAPTGTIAVGETITWPVSIENPGTDPVTLGTYTSSLGDPVTCPADPVIAAGGAQQCSTSHVLTAADITAGTLDVTVTADATVSACNIGPLTPVLTDTQGVPFEFTDVQENGANVTGYAFNGQLLDANGNETGQFHIRVESDGANTAARASQTGNDVTWQADIVTQPSPPIQVHYVIDTVADGFISAGNITTTGMPPVDNGSVNGATGFDVNLLDQATGAILLAEDQPDEVINADAGDTLIPGTVYNLTDTNVTGAEAPQYVVQYAFDDIVDGDRAGFWFNQYGGAIRYEQHLLSLNLSGCSTAPVTITGSGSNSVTTWQPAISVAKSSPVGTLAVGETVAYSFDIANTGNVELANITLDDPFTPNEACETNALAAGEATACTATYVVTQADVDSGSLDNTATVTGTLPDGTTTVTDTATVSAPITANGAMTITKTASPIGADVGDTINYSIDVANTGNVTLNTVTVDDPLTTDESCPPGSLAPGAAITCTATYTITVADADNGTIANTATVTALDPSGATVTATGTNDYAVNQSSAMTVTKTASPLAAGAGETITYSIVVENLGNVTLSSVTVDDPLTTDEACPTDPIVPGASLTCTATYTITQADADGGTISNTATVTAVDPADTVLTASGTNNYAVSQNGALSVSQTTTISDPNRNGLPDAGEIITYTITVTNSGSVTIDNIVVDDPIGTPTCDGTTIGAGEVITCTVERALTQAEIDAGTISNTATASGTDPGGTPVSANGTVDTTLLRFRWLVTRKASATSTFAAGDTLSYTIVVRNGGNVTLSNFAISDPLDPAASCPTTTLIPNEQMVCTANYVATQADVDAGDITNTATITAIGPTGNSITRTPSYSTSASKIIGIVATKKGTVNDVNANGMIDVGEPIDYKFVVDNPGTVTASGLAIADPTAGDPTCDITDVLPGQLATCTVAYPVTQADIDRGYVTNNATATATAPDGRQLSQTLATTTVIPQQPELSVSKTGTHDDTDDNGRYDVDETISYAIDVTNTGNVTVDTFTIDDPLTEPPMCDFTSLAPGASGTCSASYVLTQAAIDSGEIRNDVTVTGADPGSNPVSASATTTNTADPVQSMTVDKTGVERDTNDNGTIEVGEFIDYTITVTNSGNVTISNLAVNDPTAGTPTCDIDVLASGAVATCTVALALTQAHFDAGEIVNTAFASGTDPNTTAVTAEGFTSMMLPTSPSLSFAKTGAWVDGNDDGVAQAGEAVDFTMTVLNTGNVTISNVAISDPLTGTPTCDVATIAPNAVATCTSSYTLTQVDVDAGQVVNDATVNAIDPKEAPLQATDSATVAITAAPSLSVAKTGNWVDANENGMVDAGESIDYTISVTNTGNVSVAAVAVTDPKAGTPTCDADALAPGDVATCLVSYSVTEDDIRLGSVANSANATATAPGDVPVAASGATSTQLIAVPRLTASKSGTIVDVNGDGVTGPGDQIAYMIMVTNSGNLTVSLITASDALTGPPACDAAELAPGAKTDCAVIYTLTQADIDAGRVDNTATVEGVDSVDGLVTVEASTSTIITAVSAIEVTKSSSVTTYTAGSVVSYSIVVRNTGNVTIGNIAIEDALTTDESCPSTSLAPGEQMTCTATYTLTQSDIDAGSTENVASITGTDPNGGEVSGIDGTFTPYEQAPSLSINKVGTASDDNGNGQTDVGDTVRYVITVENTGNVTVTGVVVSDPLLADLTCDVTELAPGMQARCDGSLALTQSDIDAGELTNEASVTGRDPAGTDVTAATTVTTVLVREPQLTVDVTDTHGDTNGDGVFQATETMNYSATVTNSGNVTVDNLVVTDPTLGTFTCDLTALSPGQSSTCTATHPLSQAEVDSGQLSVSPTASGVEPTGATVSATQAVNTMIAALPELTVLKSTDVSAPVVGDTITYTISVANSGNVTVANIVVTDDLTVDETCDGTTAAPGESVTCTATHVVTQADVDNGSLANTARALGTAPNGDEVLGTGDVSTPFDQQPSIAANKSAIVNDANNDGIIQPGETIDYTVTVTNTGNVTVFGVAVDDPTTGTPVCAANIIGPGESTDCSVSHALTATDVDGGRIDNTATASATAPNGSTVTAKGSVSTVIDAVPGLSVTKTGALNDANDNGIPDVGETMEYTIATTNTGNVTITDITITDTIVPTPGCDLASLEAGERVDCVISYTLTQADIDWGSVANTAAARGILPNGDTISADDSIGNPLDGAPSIDVKMSAALEAVQAAPANSNPSVSASETVIYSFVLTNTGNVTLYDVNVTDDLSTGVTCPSFELAAGEQITCTSSYELTQADVDTGNVTNSGTVSAVDPVAEIISATATIDLPLLVEPSVDVVKTGKVVDLDTNHAIAVGDSIEFTVTVTNTGNVTISNLAVDDPLTGPPACDSTSLVPGAVATCAATYTITQADIDAQTVKNTASVTGDWLDAPVSASTEVALPAPSSDSASGEMDQPLMIDVLGNDAGHYDPNSLRLVDADMNMVMRLTVDGEGTWTVEGDKLKVMPVTGFTGTTSPVRYMVTTVDGVDVMSEVSATFSGPETTTTISMNTTTTSPAGTTTTSPADRTTIPTTITTVTTVPNYPAPTTTDYPAPTGGLPSTGLVGGVVILGVGALLVLAGVGLVLSARRRSARNS